MAKRTATSELNHDNWCDDEEPETAGVFQKASADALKGRQIRTARRRGVAPAVASPTESPEQAGTKSIFAGFTGFKKAEPVSSKAVFSFLAATPNGSGTKSDAGSAPSVSESTSANVAEDSKKPSNGLDSTSDSSLKSNDKEYYRKLKGLNESVSKWISSHVSSNPLIILTPIFRDYEKHLAAIQGKDDSKTNESSSTSEETKSSGEEKKNSMLSEAFGKTSNTEVSKTSDKSNEEKKTFSSSIFGSSANSSSTATFSFGSAATASPGQTQFCFGSPPASNPPSTAPTFSFGSGSASSPSAGFSFGQGKPFTFGNVASNNTEEKKDEDDDADDDTPPKPDHTPVNEEGATYTKRCKVFVKQGKEYKDKGIGNLFLKPVDGEKVQLIVRADTSLGNVLLNFIVGSSIPIQRLGANNVCVVCIPTPDAQPPPVTILLRVKTSADADELFSTLEKHKKEAAELLE